MEPRCVSVLDVCVRVLRTGMLLVSGFRRFGVREGAERTSDVRGARVGAVRGGRVGGGGCVSEGGEWECSGMWRWLMGAWGGCGSRH
jgi:hypothetical protein